MQEMSDTYLNYLLELLEKQKIKVIHPKKRTYIMYQGLKSEDIYILKSGVAKLTNVLKDGREFSTFYVTDVDFVSLLEENKYDTDTSVFTVRVETQDSYFYKLPRKLLEQWQKEDIIFANIITDFYKRRLLHNIDVHKRMSVNGKKGAVCACLGIMVDYFGIQKREGILLNFHLTNEDIASFCGISTRNSVNRILHDLKNRGIISIINNKIIIHDLKFLDNYNQ